MCGKLYRGEKYSFNLPETNIGSGGNGCVYEINTLEEENDKTYAVKFFKYDEKEDQVWVNKRYKRFCEEIDFLENEGKQIAGILPILDKHIPNEWPSEDEAWFMMPRAYNYEFWRKWSLLAIIQDMLAVAETIKDLHKRGIAHRDIKPANLLVYEGRLCLCDYGLVWRKPDERITAMNERIGPKQIMPQELEHVNIEKNIDFSCSDVYLFAKTLWIFISKNGNGFKGPYDRGREMVYLDKSDYRAVSLEPIHQLLEGATKDLMFQRINIYDCIKLLKDQIHILSNDPMWQDLRKYYCYMEETNRIIKCETPEEVSYTDETQIIEIINSIAKNANTYIIETGEEKYSIPFSECKRFSRNVVCLFGFMFNGSIVKRYYCKVRKLVYNTKDSSFKLELDDINDDEKKTHSIDDKEKNTEVFMSTQYIMFEMPKI